MTADLTDERRARMERIYAAFKEYVVAYESETYFQEYHDETFIKDMLYGIGIAIDRDKYAEGRGFEQFKEHLRTIINDR